MVDADLVDLTDVQSLDLGGVDVKRWSKQELKSPADIDITGFYTDPEDLSGASFKVVGATLEADNFSFSVISVELTEDVGIGAACTDVPCDHCYLIVDHC